MNKKHNENLSSKVICAINFGNKKGKNRELNVSMNGINSINTPNRNILLGINVPNKVYESPFKSDENVKVTLLSTWKIRCGIATYTEHLMNAINKEREKERKKEIVNVMPFTKGKNTYIINNDLLHLQHEFGIMPNQLTTKSKMLVTFHTVYKDQNVLIQLEKVFNIVGYIAHFKESEDVLRRFTKKPVYRIPHGSVINPYVNVKTKEEIREKLNFAGYGISNTDKCAFVFGFQSGNKNFARIIAACKNKGIKLIISGGKHECGFSNIMSKKTKQSVVFLEKFLSDEEVDMFSFACDLLIFDYVPGRNYSCSGAMHRIVGSGNPVICSRVNHFNDIQEYTYCLKFSNQKELELKIEKALEMKDELSKKALEYANNSSWEIVAKQHLDVYRNYVENIDEKIVDEKVVDEKKV